jgi:hypothetical protein
MGNTVMQSGHFDNCNIETPHDLRYMLYILRDALKKGELVQYWPEEAVFASELDVMELKDDETWPDYVELYFLAPITGKKYKLAVETFHGAGGTWSSI